MMKWDVVALYKQAAEQKQETDKKAAGAATTTDALGYVPEEKSNFTLLAM